MPLEEELLEEPELPEEEDVELLEVDELLVLELLLEVVPLLLDVVPLLLEVLPLLELVVSLVPPQAASITAALLIKTEPIIRWPSRHAFLLSIRFSNHFYSRRVF